jgi:hypothetical protein
VAASQLVRGRVSRRFAGCVVSPMFGGEAAGFNEAVILKVAARAVKKLRN